MRKPTPFDMFMLVVIAAIWGSSFFAIKVAVTGGIGPVTVAAGRTVIAAVVLYIYIRLRGHGLPRGLAAWAPLFWIGLFSSALPFFLISWGEQEISSGLAAILMSMSPLFALILSHFLTAGDRFTLFKLMGVAIGFSGVLVVIGLDPLSELGLKFWSQVAVMGASLCYVTAGIITTRVRDRLPADVMTAGSMIVAAVLTLPASLAFEAPLAATAGGDALLAVIYLGLVPTAIAFMLRMRMIVTVGLTFFAMVGYLIPVFGVFWGAALLGEEVPLKSLAALALILGGIQLSRMGQAREKARAKARDAETEPAA